MDNTNQTQEGSTEQRIFEAAREEFTQKGMDGAKMQDIADRAGINKALLHYYYRSKEKLFEAVAKVVISKALPNIPQILESDLSLHDKISHFVEVYTDVVRRNPFVPVFIISEINKHPEQFLARILPAELPQPQAFFQQVEMAVERGEIRPVDPRHLVMNIVSMCVFPVIAKPMMRILLGMSAEEANTEINRRPEIIKTFIFNALRP